MNTLDTDLLRTFLAISDAGSFLAGAARIHRSQSAASIQIKKLEALLGTRVFERHGRGIRLTPTGEKLLPAARQSVRLLDKTFAELGNQGLEGALRIGIPDDHSKAVLSRIIADFARMHPKIELTVHCALSSGFANAVANGALDIAVHEVQRVEDDMLLLREEQLQWAASRELEALEHDPVPVALFDRACWWRDIALESLQVSGRRYRVVYSSESSTGIAAAIEAGIAIGVLASSALDDGLVPVPASAALKVRPTSKLVIQHGNGIEDGIRNAITSSIITAFHNS